MRPAGHGIFLPGLPACGHQMHQTRCSHAAAQGQLSQRACAGHGTGEGTGTCPGGCSQAPCPTKHMGCPFMSLHVLLPTRPTVCRNQERRVTGAMLGDLGIASITANTSQERWAKLSSAMFGLQLDSVLRVFPIPEDSVTVQLTSALTLCSPSSPPPDQNQVQGWVLPAPTDTIRSGPVLLCWAQTSGPAG